MMFNVLTLMGFGRIPVVLERGWASHDQPISVKIEFKYIL